MTTPYPIRNEVMKARRRNGDTYVQIAKDYGLTPARVRQIVTRRTSQPK